MESSQQFQPQQPEAESPDLTSGIAPTNIDESSDETSEKNPTMNNRLENPNNIQTQHVTAEDDTINEEPAATNFAAEIPNPRATKPKTTIRLYKPTKEDPSQ